QSKHRAQPRACNVSDERRRQPHPPMHAAGGDAAEVRADVAAVRDARAVAEHQAADDRGGNRPQRHAPRGREPARDAGGCERGERSASSCPCARRSTTIVTTVSSVNAARLTASPAGAPSIVSSDNGLVAGSALHHGMWAVPITDPATNAASVASIRVLPPPAE